MYEHAELLALEPQQESSLQSSWKTIFLLVSWFLQQQQSKQKNLRAIYVYLGGKFMEAPKLQLVEISFNLFLFLSFSVLQLKVIPL